MLKLHHVTDEVERLRQYIAEMEDGVGPRPLGAGESN